MIILVNVYFHTHACTHTRTHTHTHTHAHTHTHSKTSQLHAISNLQFIVIYLILELAQFPAQLLTLYACTRQLRAKRRLFGLSLSCFVVRTVGQRRKVP